MKRTLIATIVLAFGTVLATASFAQGRHDEKPHGSTKPSVERTEYERVPSWGGRHDERPHGPRKPAATKQGPKGGTETVPKADECCK